MADRRHIRAGLTGPRSLSGPNRRDEGAVAIITVVLVAVVFLGLAALVVDLGLGRDTRRQAQNASDASALAAGNVLYLSGRVDFTGAIVAAKAFAATNYGVTDADWGTCSDASALSYLAPATALGGSYTNCISFNSSTAPVSVRVKVPVRAVKTSFAQSFGVTNVPVSAAARIQLVIGAGHCGLCVIGPGTHDLQNGSIDVSGANVAINGTLNANPQASIITVAGGTIDLQGNTPSQGTYSPAPLTYQPPVADPLPNLPMPIYTGLPYANTNACPGTPGIYDHLIACSGMQAGLYVLTGQTHMSGNENIVANGVTLYFLCGTPAAPRACHAGGESGGDLQMTGNGTLTITAPTTAPNQGLSIVADRNNTATFSFRGNGAQANSGTIYAPGATLDIRGNGAANNLDSLVVVGNITFSGSNAAFQSTYTQGNNLILSSDLHLSE